MPRLLAITFALLALFQGVQATEGRPNLLFLFADDLAHWAIHSMGNEEVRTPNLDRLAARGVTFTHACNMGSWHGAVCMPGRGMLNTGRFLWDFKSVDDHLKQEQRAGHLWSQYLGKPGYRTFMAGKWHVRCVAQEVFDQTGTVREGMPGTVKQSYDRPHLGKPDPWNAADTSLGGFWEGGRHWSEVLADESIAFLNDSARDAKPFFMYVAFNAPHDPRQSPQSYLDLYPAEKIRVPANFLPEYPFRNGIGPGVPAGRSTDEPIYYQDVMPTTLELAGVEKPEQVRFKSLLPIIGGNARSKHPSIYTAYIHSQRAVTRDGWKLLLYPDIKKAQLLHLTDDPLEMRDLSGDAANAARMKKLLAELLRWQKETGDNLDLRASYPELQ